MADYGWQGPTLWQAADLTTTAGRKWLLEDIIGLQDALGYVWKILKLEWMWKADSVTITDASIGLDYVYNKPRAIMLLSNLTQSFP